MLAQEDVSMIEGELPALQPQVVENKLNMQQINMPQNDQAPVAVETKTAKV